LGVSVPPSRYEAVVVVELVVVVVVVVESLQDLTHCENPVPQPAEPELETQISPEAQLPSDTQPMTPVGAPVAQIATFEPHRVSWQVAET
jgi:hypothetical protein